jgi:broad specificity phosphatase PhoE
LKSLREQHHRFYLVIYPDLIADSGELHHATGFHCGGGLDLGLSELGIEEARKLAHRFKKNPLKIKKIIAGPELRSIQMADVLHDDIKAKLFLNKEFSDQNLGALEGKPLAAGESSFLVQSHPPSGENDEVFSLRVRQGLERLLEDEVLCLLVAHPRVATQVLTWLGLGKEHLARNRMYSIDIPAGQGIAHFREV